MKARQCAFKTVVSRHGDTEFVEHPGARHVVSLLDYFSTRGRSRNESHVCMVLEPLGETLLNFLDRYRTQYGGNGELSGVPMNLVKVIAKQVLMGLEYLHDECGLVHTDIKPENIRTHPESPLNHPITYMNNIVFSCRATKYTGIYTYPGRVIPNSSRSAYRDPQGSFKT
jgi:serine/threonine protein kinase